MKTCEICGVPTKTNYWKYCEHHALEMKRKHARENKRKYTAQNYEKEGRIMKRCNYDLIEQIETHDRERFALLKDIGIFESRNKYFDRFILD